MIRQTSIRMLTPKIKIPTRVREARCPETGGFCFPPLAAALPPRALPSPAGRRDLGADAMKQPFLPEARWVCATPFVPYNQKFNQNPKTRTQLKIYRLHTGRLLYHKK
jgi:hypothetical protein